jgi:CheY-like chemotaxis protein
VEDNGVGMDEVTRSRIFEPFFTTKGVNQGTGMGLATVYGIAKQHHGWVEVQTAPNQGATFRVYLPVTDRAIEPATTEAGGRGLPRKSHTILVVEDDHAVRGLVVEVLKDHRYEVLEAENADLALEVWLRHSHEIELLLTDIMMPGTMNGLELGRRLQQDRPQLKVIYSSGYSSDLFTTDIQLQDGVNYLPKPYLFSKLTRIIFKALEEMPPDRGHAGAPAGPPVASREIAPAPTTP